MIKGIQIGASVMCANFLKLEQEIRDLEKFGIDFIHYDVMDGHFVPNFGLNLDMLKTIRKITAMPVNVHFMAEEPAAFFEQFAKAGCNSISFHQEGTVHVHRSIMQIKELGIQAGLALNPATPLDVLDFVLDDLDFVNLMTVNPGFSGQKLIPATLIKIKNCRQIIEKQDHNTNIQVDGNVSFENIPQMVEAGANMLVCGTSSLYKEGINLGEAMENIRRVIH